MKVINLRPNLLHLLIFGVGLALLLQAYTDAKVAYENGLRAMVAHIPTVETPPPQQELEEIETIPEKKLVGHKNENAPLAVYELRSEGTRAYIERFSKIAIAEMQKYGIPASISLAQGLVESRYGTSKLAVQNNNHFGIKCFSKKCRPGHCSNFFDDHHKDFFRKFGSPWESWRAHSQMLASGRYARLKKHGRDYRKWAQGLKQLGYATDRKYAEKLIGVIEKYDLHKYDNAKATTKYSVVATN